MKFSIKKSHLIFNLIIVSAIFFSCMDKKEDIIKQEFNGSNIEYREITLKELFQLLQVENKINSAAAICNCEPINLIEIAQDCQNSIISQQNIYVDSLKYFANSAQSIEEERINKKINLLKEEYSKVGKAQSFLWSVGLYSDSPNSYELFVVEIKEMNETYICNLNTELGDIEYKLLLDE